MPLFVNKIYQHYDGLISSDNFMNLTDVIIVEVTPSPSLRLFNFSIEGILFSWKQYPKVYHCSWCYILKYFLNYNFSNFPKMKKIGENWYFSLVTLVCVTIATTFLLFFYWQTFPMGCSIYVPRLKTNILDIWQIWTIYQILSIHLLIWQILLQSKLHHLKGCDSLIFQLKANYFHGNSVQRLTSALGDIVFNISQL